MCITLLIIHTLCHKIISFDYPFHHLHTISKQLLTIYDVRVNVSLQKNCERVKKEKRKERSTETLT